MISSLIERFADPDLPDASGSGCAAVAGLSAAIVAKVARASTTAWPQAAGAAAQAEALRARCVSLVDEDAAAYATARSALRDARSTEAPTGDGDLGSALVHAADVPLRIVELAGDVAMLAATAAAEADPDVRADAVVACLLSQAAARGAAHLVEINLAIPPGDHRLERAHSLIRDIARVSEGLESPN